MRSEAERERINGAIDTIDMLLDLKPAATAAIQQLREQSEPGANEPYTHEWQPEDLPATAEEESA